MSLLQLPYCFMNLSGKGDKFPWNFKITGRFFHGKTGLFLQKASEIIAGGVLEYPQAKFRNN